MTNINIVYDDMYDDADIIAIPDFLVSAIEAIGQEFLFWIPTTDDEKYWIYIDGKKCSIAETIGFIDWLNSTYCKETEKAYIISQNTNYCPDYKIIEF